MVCRMDNSDVNTKQANSIVGPNRFLCNRKWKRPVGVDVVVGLFTLRFDRTTRPFLKKKSQ